MDKTLRRMLIPLALTQFVAIGHKREVWDQCMTHKVYQVGELLPTSAFDLVGFYGFERTLELDRRGCERRASQRIL